MCKEHKVNCLQHMICNLCFNPVNPQILASIAIQAGIFHSCSQIVPLKDLFGKGSVLANHQLQYIISLLTLFLVPKCMLFVLSMSEAELACLQEFINTNLQKGCIWFSFPIFYQWTSPYQEGEPNSVFYSLPLIFKLLQRIPKTLIFMELDLGSWKCLQFHTYKGGQWMPVYHMESFNT